MKRRGLSILVVLLISLPSVVPADDAPVANIYMARAKLKPTLFSLDVSELSAEEKRVLEYALKQWLMYDKCPVAGKDNPNTSNPHVMAAGENHDTGDFHWRNPATGGRELKARSSRSMSTVERELMGQRYGAMSPFHPEGQPVPDPTTPGGRAYWFTTNPQNTHIKVKKYAEIPGEKKTTLGKADYQVVKNGDTEYKNVLAPGNSMATPKGPELQLRIAHPKGKPWCYPTDTDGDGWITNKDTPCPAGSADYYALVKHELGHFFCFLHQGVDFSEHDEGGCCPGHGPPQGAGPLNSPDNDGGPSHGKDNDAEDYDGRMYFHSDRPGGFGGFDIYYSIWDSDLQQWGTPQNCGPWVNSPFDDVDPNSGFGDAFILFASNRPGGQGGFDIYQAPRTDTAAWDTVYTPTGINSPANDTAPHEWNDRTLFFVSDRPGGPGNKDIWVATTLDTFTFKWAQPQPLPAQINTPANDEDPFVAYLSPDGMIGRLYLASNRPGGQGGYDIYGADLTGGAWNAPINIGNPNSPNNEKGPEISGGYDLLYFETDFGTAIGGTDIRFAPNISPRPRVWWNDDDSGNPTDTVQVSFYVFNKGLIPLSIVPVVTTNHTWSYSWNPTPFFLLPDSSKFYTVDVIIGASASVGEEARFYLTAIAGPASASDSASAWAYGPTAVGDDPPRWTNGLRQNYPNPFNPVTIIEYTIATAGRVRLSVYDVSGRLVRSLVDDANAVAGSRRVEWDGRNGTGEGVASGIYFYRLQTADFTQTRKMVLLR